MNAVRASSPEPPLLDPLLALQAAAQTWAAGVSRSSADALRAQRLTRLIEHTLRHSPLYQRRTGAKGSAHGLRDFKPVSKTELMAHFDDWATDRRITLRGAQAFVAQPANVGNAWLQDYLLWTSAGTSGHPGLFVQDRASLAAYDAIDAHRLRPSLWPGVVNHPAWGLHQRFAFVGAIGGHYAGHVSLQRQRRLRQTWWPAAPPAIHELSVLQPLPLLAQQLQALQPTVLITYPSCAAALAQRQAQSQLQLQLTEVWTGGEQLSPAQRQLITGTFKAAVRNTYGASEFFSIACECAHGQLHLNHDWVVLEPVDEQGRAVPEGVLSHNVWLTHLANLTQPLLRYVLPDRVRLWPGGYTCACGSPLPVLEVQGRADDSLQLAGRRGGRVTVLPLALTTAVEEQAGVAQFQLLCRGPNTLELRLEPGLAHGAKAVARIRAALLAFLAQQGVAKTRVDFNPAAPLQGAGGGKLLRVRNLTHS